jgi:hypothetical protein
MFMSRRSLISISLGLTLISALAWGGKNFVMPSAQPAQSYPAHDAHPDENITVGLDPYDMPDKANIFTVKYKDVGYLPIFMVITNDGNQPISLHDVKVQFITVDRTKISPATEDDIYRRISRPTRSGNTIPLPFPKGGKIKGTVGEKAMDEIQNSRFIARAVEPHSSQSGFLFFDVSGISTPLAGAHLYLTGAQDSKGNDLMYFEIPLEKYLSAPTK